MASGIFGWVMSAAFVGLGIVILATVLGVGADVLTGIQGNQVADSVSYNITADGISAVEDVAGNQGTIATVGIAAVVLGLLFAAFVGLFGKQID